MRQTEKQPTCEEKVSTEWQDRRSDLYALYLTSNCGYVDEFIEAQGFDYRGKSPEEKSEAFYEIKANYGLSFDYVHSNTFDDQDEGYFRYQFSWGGPSDELRFYVDLEGKCHRAEYWFMDWYDGASLDVTGDEVAQATFDDFDECGMIVVPDED